MIRHPFVAHPSMVTGNLLDDTTEPICQRCSYPVRNPRHVPEPPDRLFTVNSETYWSTIADAVREYVDLSDERTLDFKVEESTVVDPVKHLCSSDHLIDTALDWASDNGEIDEFFDDELRNAAKLPHVIEAFDKALRMLANSTTYRMADELVATHHVTVTRHPGGGWSWSETLT